MTVQEIGKQITQKARNAWQQAKQAAGTLGDMASKPIENARQSIPYAIAGGLRNLERVSSASQLFPYSKIELPDPGKTYDFRTETPFRYPEAIPNGIAPQPGTPIAQARSDIINLPWMTSQAKKYLSQVPVYEGGISGSPMPGSTATTGWGEKFGQGKYDPKIRINPASTNASLQQIVLHEMLHANPVPRMPTPSDESPASSKLSSIERDFLVRYYSNPRIRSIIKSYNGVGYPGIREAYAKFGEIMGPEALNDPVLGKYYQGIFQ